MNNAGINLRKNPQDYKTAEWDEIIDVNLRGAFLFSQAVYPAMKAAGGGKIINIGSMTSIFGVGQAPVYGASKGGIVQLTRSLAVAWAPDHIQVNALRPGWIDTDLTRDSRRTWPDLNERVLSRTPAGRWGEPTDFWGGRRIPGQRRFGFHNRCSPASGRRFFHHGLKGKKKLKSDQKRWDDKFRGKMYTLGTEANPFLRKQIRLLPRGKALDVAAGEGKNAVFLAQHGFDVEAVDISQKGLSKARRLAREKRVKLKTVLADLDRYRI